VNNGRGASVDDYQAPLFIAWQLTNRCTARCLHCCEESGPDNAWPDELTEKEALKLARDIADRGIPYAAFGGGEPLGVPHVWEVFRILASGGVELKIETDGLRIDDAKADLLVSLKAQCVQISLDGASAETHGAMRPGGDFNGALAAVHRLARRGIPPEWVFVPSKRNLEEIGTAYEMAAEAGCRAFVSGPMMRLGRAGEAWDGLAVEPGDWSRAVSALQEKAGQHGGYPRLSLYPWDIVKETRERLESPQAMMLVVPNGKVKLLNALPFAPADLREHGIDEAWARYIAAWSSPAVRGFIERIQTDPSLLRHANETWAPETWSARTSS